MVSFVLEWAVAWVIVVVAVMAGVNVWTRVGPGWAQPVTGPAAALLLVAIADLAGLSWVELGLDLGRGGGWAAGAVGAVVVAYGVALVVPAGRRALRDPRHRKPLRSAVFTALVAVPLATVMFEEVAFRGVLWGMVEREGGPVWAAVVTSLLFGLWHVGSGADLARSRDGRQSLTVAGAVAFTTLTGFVFAALREIGGGLLAPVALHWAANGLGVIASAWVWRTTPGMRGRGEAGRRPAG